MNYALQRALTLAVGGLLGALLCALVLRLPLGVSIGIPLGFAVGYAVLFFVYVLLGGTHDWRESLRRTWARPISRPRKALAAAGAMLLVVGYGISPAHGFKIGLLLMALGSVFIAAGAAARRREEED